VPQARLFRRAESGDRCAPRERVAVPPRFRPALPETPVTQATPYDSTQPAAAALATSPEKALPELVIESEDALGAGETWQPQRDLLNSKAVSTEFVVEVEADGATLLRFGDDAHGKRPNSGTQFRTARYRVGNGAAGNIGAGALFHIVTGTPGVAGVRQPLPARGGVEPETMEEVRNRAPYAFRTQARAVTEADYAAMAERNAAVQRAAATFRWTGSWHTVFVTADPLGGLISDAEKKDGFEAAVLAGLERFRMAGHDLEADEPRYVSLEIEMHVCVKPDYFRSEVHAALLEVFSARLLPDGRRGIFHPDHFTFGQPVHLSPLYAAAQALPGVGSVHITTFQRQGQPSLAALQSGRLELDRLEIARCDNDPNFRERGIFRIDLGGGK
jgi:predicted phage baseplate assembly protein